MRTVSSIGSFFGEFGGVACGVFDECVFVVDGDRRERRRIGYEKDHVIAAQIFFFDGLAVVAEASVFPLRNLASDYFSFVAGAIGFPFEIAEGAASVLVAMDGAFCASDLFGNIGEASSVPEQFVDDVGEVFAFFASATEAHDCRW